MNSEKFSQSLHISKEFLLQKKNSIKKYSITTSILVHFQKNLYFEMRMKNWIEWINKISKIWEKIRTQTYFKFLHIVSRLWADCERQSLGKSKWSRKTSHNVGNKSKRRRLLFIFDGRLWWYQIKIIMYSHLPNKRACPFIFFRKIWDPARSYCTLPVY